jgi:hypothetical protein
VKTYLVFERAEGGRTVDAAERILFVREKFFWLALILPLFWLLWHRLWVGLLGWIGAVVLIGIVIWALNLDQITAAAASLIPSLVVALEGTELRRRKLLRRGFRDTGVVVAEDLEDAERRFFTRWLAREEALRPTPAVPLPPLPQTSVIGLFPEPGAAR